MSDLNYLFEQAPEGAIALRQTPRGTIRWFNLKGEQYSCEEWCEAPKTDWQTIAVQPRPERKTVENAVARLSDATIPAATTHIGVAKIPQTGWLKKGEFEFVGQDCDKYIFDIVCTIEEFKAFVAAKAIKSEPEWTHTYGGGNCYIKVSEPDFEGFIIIVSEVNGYILVKPADLKPIKPTITEKERETVAKFVARIYTQKDCNLRKEFDDFISEHEVVE